jgi:hypothetical protein
MRKNIEQPNITTAELQDQWNGKKVRIKDGNGSYERGWEARGARVHPEPQILAVILDEYNRVREQRWVKMNDIELE